jgi:uncharacterized membrane protein YedE/YeeE
LAWGLGLSQMIDRDRVLGFLDVTGQWDPTLLFVLGGAVGVTIISFRLVLRLPHPFLSPRFYLPTAKSIDLPLMLGATLFGIGWGIAGYCPGPGNCRVSAGHLESAAVFRGAFIIGSLMGKTVLGQLQSKL